VEVSVTRSVVFASLLAPSAFAGPISLTHAGRLTSAAGAPVDGPQDLVVTLYGPSAAVVHTESFDDVPVEGGFFSVVIGAGGGLDASELTPPIDVGVTVGGVEILPRQRLVGVPEAARAHVALGVPVAGASASSCAEPDGTVRFDTSIASLRVCSAGRWVPIGVRTVRSFGAYRAWSDGSTARSCEAYRRPATGAMSVWSGDTGDGVYRINYGNGDVDVWCDQTTDEGGWTLVWKNQNTLQSPTAAALNVPGLASPTLDAFAKLSNTDINAMKSSTSTTAVGYRVEQFRTWDTNASCAGTNGVVGYIPASCAFNWVSGTANPGGECTRGRTTYTGSFFSNTYPSGTGSWCFQNNKNSTIFCAHNGTDAVVLHWFSGFDNSCQHSLKGTRVWAR
jgi:hypothetical protein